MDDEKPRQWDKSVLVDELENFIDIAGRTNPTPEKIPRLKGVDVHGVLMPSRGAVGGDHILFVDFSRRYDLDGRIAEAEAAGRTAVAEQLRLNRRRAGILIADVSGHRVTDATIVVMLHQAFLLGTLYELDTFGQITTQLFEHINTRFHRTNSVSKYLTMIYGEISDEGRFRFISAGHQPPLTFSREYGRFLPISPDRLVSFPPIGMFPTIDDRDLRTPSNFGYKKRYTVNEINLLAPGDVLLLYTDGLAEHAAGAFLPTEVEKCFRENADEPAKVVAADLRERVLASGRPTDDLSFVIVRKVPVS